ncbi:hypothetical protein HQ590_07255 [bacterium]|nr:hypothetical protein [bacterium]
MLLSDAIMYALDLASVPQWTNVNNLWFPVSVGTNCPYCAQLVTFTPTYQQYDPHRKTIASLASCPACNKVVYIWAINPGPALQPDQKGCQCLAIFPEPRLPRQAVPGVDLLPPHIAKAYHDALGVFNAALWSATGTCCRRTLEGVTGQLLGKPAAGAVLAEQVQQLSQAVDLDHPLKTLAEALRPGGPVDKHFNLQQEPDPETAQAMLDLIECALAYLFTLPAMIDRLQQKLATGPSPKAAATTQPTPAVAPAARKPATVTVNGPRPPTVSVNVPKPATVSTTARR